MTDTVNKIIEAANKAGLSKEAQAFKKKVHLATSHQDTDEAHLVKKEIHLATTSNQQHQQADSDTSSSTTSNSAKKVLGAADKTGLTDEESRIVKKKDYSAT